MSAGFPAEAVPNEVNDVMPPHDWALHRRLVLMPGVERERSHDITAARPNINVAITEYAIRELYARVKALEAKLAGVESWTAAQENTIQHLKDRADEAKLQEKKGK